MLRKHFHRNFMPFPVRYSWGTPAHVDVRALPVDVDVGVVVDDVLPVPQVGLRSDQAQRHRRRAYAARSNARWNWWLCTPTSRQERAAPPPGPEEGEYRRSVCTYSSTAWTSTGAPRHPRRRHAPEVGHRAVGHEPPPEPLDVAVGEVFAGLEYYDPKRFGHRASQEDRPRRAAGRYEEWRPAGEEAALHPRWSPRCESQAACPRAGVGEFHGRVHAIHYRCS